MEDVYHTPIQNIKQSLRRGRTIEEINSMTETYLLESPNGSPSTNNRSQNSTKRSRRLKRQKVVEEDLYDEDHYSLPNLNACVTKSAGVLQAQEDGQEKQTCYLKKKQLIMIICAVIILTLVIIGVITVFLIFHSGEFHILCHIHNFVFTLM